MSIRDIGPLLGADEGLNHQIVDTFATIAHSDYAWTEKVWVSIAKADGSIQANLGLGKYPNRGVIDGFGGVSRGREQWTVRGSGELWSPPATARSQARTRGMMKWTPAFFRRPDSTYYESSIFLTGGAWNYSSAYVNDESGRQDRVRAAEPRMQYDPHTRFVRRGELHLVMDSGEARTI